MARIDLKTSQIGSFGTGDLQLQNGVAMDATLRLVTDAVNTASPLKLSTALVQSTSTVKITTSDVAYIDAEDNSGNNRFTVSRAVASQLVTVDFASVPSSLTTPVGAIRTATDGVNLANVMTFLENGKVGVKTDTPVGLLSVVTTDTNGVLDIFANDGSSSPLTIYRYGGNVPINLNTSGGTSASPTFVGDNVAMSRLTTNTYNGTTFSNSARIEVLAKGVHSATNFGSSMRFLTTAENTITMAERVRITSAGLVGIGTATPTTALDVVGSGSTSATTSLLVQNSAGTNLFFVQDDNVIGSTAGKLQMSSSSVNHVLGLFTFSTNGSGRGRLQGCEQINGTSGAGGTRFSSSPDGTLVDASAQLQADSTTKGFLPPRMTTAQKNAIATPAAGLMVYDTTLNKLCVYTTAWETITSV